MSISRRHFIGGVAAAPLAAAGGPLPMRVLGRTGARVSILGMGGGSRFLMYKEEDKALEALQRAFDLGITYMDTAQEYGAGLSEERVGKVVKNRRAGIFLVTKIKERNGDKAMRAFEGSLKRLQTDHLDLVHIHGIADEDDLAKAEAADGVLNVLYKLRSQKVARAIGITCHGDPAVLKTALERHDFDCTQMALNAAMAGMTKGKSYGPDFSFETVALPVAQRKQMGITAMKVFAQDALAGKAATQKLVYYAMSLPVAACVIGMPKIEHIEENVRLAKAFKPLSKAEMTRLAAELSGRHKAALDRHFADHADA